MARRMDSRLVGSSYHPGKLKRQWFFEDDRWSVIGSASPRFSSVA
jgi:hypothetical protein